MSFSLNPVNLQNYFSPDTLFLCYAIVQQSGVRNEQAIIEVTSLSKKEEM